MLHQAAKVSILSTMLLCFPMSILARGAANPEKPKLILQITIDQLRGDLPGRFIKNTGSVVLLFSTAEPTGVEKSKLFIDRH